MTTNRYSYYGPSWCEQIIDQLNGVAFEVGINSDQRALTMLSRLTMLQRPDAQARDAPARERELLQVALDALNELARRMDAS